MLKRTVPLRRLQRRRRVLKHLLISTHDLSTTMRNENALLLYTIIWEAVWLQFPVHLCEVTNSVRHAYKVKQLDWSQDILDLLHRSRKDLKSELTTLTSPNMPFYCWSKQRIYHCISIIPMKSQWVYRWIDPKYYSSNRIHCPWTFPFSRAVPWGHRQGRRIGSLREESKMCLGYQSHWRQNEGKGLM